MKAELAIQRRLKPIVVSFLRVLIPTVHLIGASCVGLFPIKNI